MTKITMQSLAADQTGFASPDQVRDALAAAALWAVSKVPAGHPMRAPFDAAATKWLASVDPAHYPIKTADLARGPEAIARGWNIPAAINRAISA